MKGCTKLDCPCGDGPKSTIGRGRMTQAEFEAAVRKALGVPEGDRFEPPRNTLGVYTDADRLPPSTFWILWNPTSFKPPTVRFTSRAQAENVAEKMAAQYHQTFYVMEAKSSFERARPLPPPVTRTVLG